MRYPVGASLEDYLKNWYIASYFGEFRNTYYHSGDDLNLKTGGDSDLGQPLYAICDGEICGTDTTSTTGFGKQIFLKFKDPLDQRKIFYAMYAHCDTVKVKVGDVVKEGNIIGTLGKSGTTVAHLHFSIKNKANGMDNVPNDKAELTEWERPIQFITDRINVISTPELEPLEMDKDIPGWFEALLGLKDYSWYDNHWTPRDMLSFIASEVARADKNDKVVKDTKDELKRLKNDVTTLQGKIENQAQEITMFLEIQKDLKEKIAKTNEIEQERDALAKANELLLSEIDDKDKIIDETKDQLASYIAGTTVRQAITILLDAIIAKRWQKASFPESGDDNG